MPLELLRICVMVGPVAANDATGEAKARTARTIRADKAWLMNEISYHLLQKGFQRSAAKNDHCNTDCLDCSQLLGVSRNGTTKPVAAGPPPKRVPGRRRHGS